MPLLLNVPTERVELTTPGEWVDVKTRLSKGEQARIQGSAFRVMGSTGEPSFELNYESTVFAGLEVGIVGWSFAEPVTPANIRALAPEDYDLITARINELWEPRTDDERKNSFGSGAQPSSTAAPSPTSSAG